MSNDSGDGGFMPFSPAIQERMERQQRLIDGLEKKKFANSISVPTDDNLVKARLIELEEPIIMFGESPKDRRARLRSILADRGITQGMPTIALPSTTNTKEDEKDEAFLREGVPELKEARRVLLEYSLKRAEGRIKTERAKRKYIEENDLYFADDEPLNRMCKKMKQIDSISSQIGDEKRPLSCVTLAPKGKLIATSSWSGQCRIWDPESCECIQKLKTNEERVQTITFHPQSGIGQSPSTCNLASAGADCAVYMWSLKSPEPVAKLTGHQARINRLVFHPNGKYIVSTSFDHTWTMWDVETGKELLIQAGHSRAVYGAAFHTDGAIIVTSGLDGLARVWDIRSGKTLTVLRGHTTQILDCDCSPNGWQIATAGGDHTLRLWDLRQRQCMYVLGAHSKVITSARFQPEYGNYLLTTSFDKTLKLWDMRDYSLIKTLAGHEEKVTACDILPGDGAFDAPKMIVSASFDKTWKVWVPSEWGDDEDMNEAEEQDAAEANGKTETDTMDTT